MLSTVQIVNSLTLTARRYGAFVLADAASGQGLVTPSRVLGRARKLSRCKEAMARFLESWYKFPGVYECRVTMQIESRLAITL